LSIRCYDSRRSIVPVISSDWPATRSQESD
jgi:hypothetical protein